MVQDTPVWSNEFMYNCTVDGGALQGRSSPQGGTQLVAQLIAEPIQLLYAAAGEQRERCTGFHAEKT